jgi:hypothetical protein
MKILRSPEVLLIVGLALASTLFGYAITHVAPAGQKETASKAGEEAKIEAKISDAPGQAENQTWEGTIEICWAGMNMMLAAISQS